MDFKTLALDAIERRPGNRAVGGFDEDRLAELTESVRQQGVVNPVTVRIVNGSYELVAGERRWLASQRAGLDNIPAVVMPADTDDVTVELTALAENLQRENMHPLDECDAF